MDQEPSQYEYPGTPDPLAVVEKPRDQRPADVGHQQNDIPKIPFYKNLLFWSVFFNGVLALIAYLQYQTTDKATKS